MFSILSKGSKLGLLFSAGLLFLAWSMPTAGAQATCSLISGVSSLATANSGAVDFENALYSTKQDRTVDGTPIDEDYRVCVDSEGRMGTAADSKGYAWNSNVGWLDFAWCLSGDCENAGQPKIDMTTGYWSGYVWSEKAGWIWLDWTCPSCDVSERVHTDLDTGVVSGYAWSDSLGWISFGGGVSLAIIPSEVTGYVSVEVTPDPIVLTKETAPLADGEGEYQIGVQVFVPATSTEPSYFLSDDPDGDGTMDYEVVIVLNATADSRICLNQIDMPCSGLQAIEYPDYPAVYDESTETWWIRMHSYAPTSNVNGYDSDHDGTIDYYFDVDPSDPDGILRSSDANRFELESIDLTVTPLTTVAPTVVWDDSDPLYNLNDSYAEAYEFKFAPAVEVAHLERSETSSLVSYMSSLPNIKQDFKGLVAKWTSATQFSGANFEFSVRSILNVETNSPAGATGADAYEFLFDNQPTATLGDGAYTHSSVAIPGSFPDSNEVDSKFIITNPGGSVPEYAEYLDKFITRMDDSRYLYVDTTDFFKPLYGGNIGIIPESGMIVPGTTTVDPDPTSPRYETQIHYYLPDIPGTKGDWVRYHSNYLPQTASAMSPEDVGISGSITSSTDAEIDISTLSSGDVVVLGDIATVTLRNELFKRFSELTKGITPPTSGSDGEVSGALELNESLGGVELLDGELIYFKDQDVHVTETANLILPAKTIVVWGGDVYLDSNLNNVGIVAFKDSAGNGGHVYIASDVVDLVNINIFADQPISSYDSSRGFDAYGFAAWTSSSDRAQLLKNQLYIKGNIVSLNTLYGSDEGLYPDYILANGQTTSDLALAKEYDLNRLREFSLCWIEVDILGNPVDYDVDGSTVDGDGNPDPGDVEACAGAIRSSYLDESVNAPVYFEYSPPTSSLPILGESESGKVNVF